MILVVWRFREPVYFYKPGYYRGLERCHLVVPEVQNLISKEDIPHFSCDITDIQGISASKSEMYDIGDIYEFPLLRCPGLVTPVNEEHLRENMQYWGEPQNSEKIVR
ncbi:DUF6685 family protein [Escherichia coli]